MRLRKIVLMIPLFVMLVTLVSPVNAQIVFNDNFNRANGSPGSDWNIISDSWAIDSNELCGTTSGGEGWIYANTPALKRPMTIEFDINFLTTPGDYIGKCGGMVIALEKATRYGTSGYTVDWLDYQGTNVYRIIRYDNGVQLTEVRFSGVVNENQVYHWKIVTDGSITLYVDNNLIGSLSDATYTNGLYFGLWLINNNQHAHFDNVNLVDPNGNPTGNVPEFEVGLPIITSMAATVYMLIRRRINRK